MVKMVLSFFALFIYSLSAHADWALNMPQGATPISRDVYNLHMTVFWICVGIGIVVFSVLIYSLIYHRKSRGAQAAEFHEHTALEIAWAVIPFIILIIIAIPATQVLIRMNDTSKAGLTIKITGYQWKWRYEYLDQGISFFSNLATPQDQLNNKAPKDRWYLREVDHPLVVPINTKIRFLLTANDVIHSWWVPELGIKRDTLPGFINEAWAFIEKPGTYRGQCAELCGAGHGFMPIVVVAVSQADFDKWVAEQVKLKTQAVVTPSAKLTKDESMARGREAYERTCAVCHKPDGMGMPPAFPALKGSKIATGPIADHINIVLNGKPGTAMQAFGPQLNDEDIAAIITYERNAWGNNTGDVLQATDITKARGKK